MKTYPVDAFPTIPGAEALPPDGSEVRRAVYAPKHDSDPYPWMLILGYGDEARAEWIDVDHLAQMGYTPADPLDVAMRLDDPIDGGERELPLVVSMKYPPGRGAFAWAAVTEIDRLVRAETIISFLRDSGDESVELLFEELQK